MQIVIGNSIIPTPAGIRLQSVFRSPLFSTPENKIPGSYIFNTPFQAIETLRRVFGQAHRVQRHGRATAELPYVITDGTLRFEGACIVTEASKDSYEIAFKIDNGDFASQLGNKTLKDLDLGGDRDIAEIFSVANTDPYVVDQVEMTYLRKDLEIPKQLISDFAENLSNSGRTFTAHATMTVRLKIRLNILSDIGFLEVVVSKNGSSIFSETINGIFHSGVYDIVTGKINFEHVITLNLVENDIITFHVFSDPQSTPLGFQQHTEIYDCLVEYMSLNSFNQAAIQDQNSSDFAIFPIHNEKFLENFPDDAFPIDNLSIKTIYSKYFPVLNYWKDGEFPIFLSGTAEDEFITCANLFTPFVYMQTLIRKIATEAGYYLVNSPFDSASFENIVLFNAYAENTYNTTSTTLISLKNTFNLTDHVPAVKQSDFLNYVTFLTGFVPVVDNNARSITFVDIKDKHIITLENPAIHWPGIILSNPVVKVDPDYKGIKLEMKKAATDKYMERIKEINDKLNYKGEVYNESALPTVGNKVNDLYFITVLGVYYAFQYNSETYTLAWSFFSEKFPLSYTEGEEPYLSIITELCPMLTSQILDETIGAPVNRSWRIPKTFQSGILEGFPDSLGADYGLQVLYYKGLTNDSLDQPYPYASADMSAEDIFDLRYKRWLRWLAYDTKPVTFKSVLTRSQLKSIKYGQVYQGEDFNFLVDEIRISMQSDGLSVAEVDIYTV